MAHRVSKPTTAYVLINCETGTQTVVIDELRTIPQVVEAYEIYGSIYDILLPGIKQKSLLTMKIN